MGANMARRLAELGYMIGALYDVRKESARELAGELKTEVVAHLADVTDASDVVITVVSDDRAMHDIFSDAGDSLLVGAAGTMFLNCATVSPAVHVDVEARAHARNALSLEVCMASSIPQARNGMLYLMVGGRKHVFDRARPILEDLSSSLR